MPEWLSHVIVAVCSAGFVGAVAALWAAVAKTRRDRDAQRHGHKRQDRMDAESVMSQAIEDLREDRDRLSRQIGHREKEIRELKDEHTACKVTLERVTAQNEGLEKRVKWLEERLGKPPGG